MNVERMAMKGKLVDLKSRQKALAMRAEGLCRAIRTALNTALTPVEDLEIPQAAQQMEDLVMITAEMSGLDAQIQRLEKELG